jgi:glutathione S-transferase
MKLYSGPLSLFSRKVEIALHEKGLAFEREMVPFNQTVGYSPKHSEVLVLNPKGQVPVLIDGELILYDSTLILEYLEDAYPAPALFPAGAAAKARCRTLDIFADEVMLVPLRALMHRTGPRLPDPHDWEQLERRAQAAELTIGQHLAWLESALGTQDFMCGEFGAADIALFMSVLYTQRLGGPPLQARPVLHTWFQRLRARPAFAHVFEEVLEADRQLSQPVVGAYGSARAAGD